MADTSSDRRAWVIKIQMTALTTDEAAALFAFLAKSSHDVGEASCSLAEDDSDER